MTIYMDSVSAQGHLMELANKIYKNDSDRRNKYIDLFKGCFFDGAIPSKCGRRIISTEKFLSNVADTIRQISLVHNDTNNYLEESALTEIIELTLKGACHNCAKYDMQGIYQPAQVAKPLQQKDPQYKNLIQVIYDRMKTNIKNGKEYTSLHSLDDFGNSVRGIHCYLSNSALEAVKEAFKKYSELVISTQKEYKLYHPTKTE